VISAARTAASAVLAAECIHQCDKRVAAFGIVGAGLISRYVVQCFLATGWQLERIAIHDIDRGVQAAFRRWLADISPETISTDGESTEAVLAQSELTLFATVAAEPHVDCVGCLSHRPTILHLSLRDLSPDLILASNNIVDDAEHVVHAGTSIALARDALGHSRFIAGTLADQLLRRITLDRARATVFSPFGLGMLDISLGRWIGNRAADAQAALSVDDFFIA
jgi:ornithine cyclodeaminase